MDAISFGTDGWRATLDTFTAPRVRMVGQAVARHLTEEDLDGPVGVCYDARESSRGFAEEIARVLCVNGFDVVMPERDRPTPLLSWNIVDRDLAGGLMITASHNPPEYNGVKFIPSDGAPALPEITEAIEANLAEPDPLPEAEWGAVREVDFVSGHAEHALELVGADPDLSVAYDAIHGSGRGVTDALLERTGAEVERLRCEEDPTFGGGSPEPTRENLAELIERVTDGDAELGVANDGDADRIAVVTPERGLLNANLLYAVLYDYLLERDSGPAVRTVSTTFLVDRIAEAHGQEAIEVPVGFKWVADAMVAADALIGGEESGGFSMRGHVPEKDGVLTALLAAAAHDAESLDDRVDRLLSEHGEIHQSRVSVDCPDEEKVHTLDALAEAIPDSVAGEPVEDVNTADGFKLLLESGAWLLVRPSGTEPKLRVYAEAESEGRVEALLDSGRELVREAR
ncbi:phosphoglucomutase/phosphomannomutase family protein [Halalkalicoccus jeotgali]|uniref:Phosphoglucomutase/phosphomannomutase alpha/beta/alpha domain I n=1 Tax=Halalkalicoccus jeotgali (strain DSM 18796 / CECT 7217 / JCM 14584 / KCTC 4019 / B3) TaxID=795797 RepID=D8J537_HALJB|nr:phosphoglucomutase/phosphomannomutase family protein [Halalkalicoccus jeotgali]ADJ13618.1 phosphoglucomutase/phosphomannomutase alpha/beta/alpha domain I [Halalkalicoccus jeotgali B3]ELY33360.1 phosphoglucomutase/phosphomannomutase alpha/beta/alpha domain I [Halalkalicoccus jeotgali B3]